MGHGHPAARLCNKDPFTKSASYIQELFPDSKFIFMVRDGRSVVHSMISRGVTIGGYDLTSYRQCLGRWNDTIAKMYDQCEYLGFGKNCLPVRYEHLVLHPEELLREILRFLDLPWNERVLHHEIAANQENGISLSESEKSTDQVVKPVYKESLSKWVGHIPDDVVADMERIAPMLDNLGYDPKANPPDYEKVVLRDKGMDSQPGEHKPEFDMNELEYYDRNHLVVWE